MASSPQRAALGGVWWRSTTLLLLCCIALVSSSVALVNGRQLLSGESLPLEYRAVLHARVLAQLGPVRRWWSGPRCSGPTNYISLPRTIGFLASTFSAPLRPSIDGSNEARVLLTRSLVAGAPDPIFSDGCTPFPPRAIDNETWFDNAILHNADGSCPFSTRVYHASLVGARMVIATRLFSPGAKFIHLTSSQPWPTYRYGNSTDPNLNVTAWLEAQPPGEGYGFASPYPEPSIISIGMLEGGSLSASLVSFFELSSCGGVVKLAFDLPGSMVSSERLALRDLASSLVMPSSIDLVTAGYGALLPLSAFLDAPSSADPCTMGLAGVWCEDGHLVSLYLANLQLSGELPSSFASFTQLRALQMPNNQLSGTLSSALCDLPLVIVDVSINSLTGTADCFCGNRTDVTQLSEIVVPAVQTVWDQYMSPFDPNPYNAPNATNGYPLLLFDASVNSIVNLPVSLLGCGNLRRLRLSQNRMSEPPMPDLIARNWPALQEINLEQAGVTGQVPTFKNLVDLETLIISQNAFSGQLKSDSFDGLHALMQLQAANLGEISGAFPRFDGTINARVIDFSDNGLTGLFVSHSYVTQLLLGGNTLLPPYSLEGLNLIELNLTRAGIRCDSDLTALLLEITREMPIIKRISLGDNDLNCTWDASAWSAVSAPLTTQLLPHLVALNVSSCNLHGPLPPSLFRALSAQLWEELDVSSNNFSGQLPPMVTPLATLTSFDARGNPLLRRDLASPERFYSIDTGSSTRISTDLMECPQLIYTGKFSFAVQLDPAYTDYEGCVCDRGYFGEPPNCVNVPSATNWTYRLDQQTMASPALPLNDSSFSIQRLPDSTFSALPALVSSQSFTDGYYGGQRFSAGMTTTFAMAADTTAAAPARVLTITLYLNPQHFDSYTDLISIYEGGDDLKGERIFSVHGSDLNPRSIAAGLPYASSYISDALIQVQSLRTSTAGSLVGLRTSLLDNAPSQGGKVYLESQWDSLDLVHTLSVTVFAPSATLQFLSLDTAGVHFVATYITSATCPLGLEPDSTPGSTKCLTVVTATSAMRAVVYVAAAFALAISLWSLISVVLFRDHDVIRGASPWCLMLMCGFMLALSCGAMTFAMLPQVGSDGNSSSAVCHLRVWLTSIPLVGVLAVLLAKSNRVVSIFSAKTLKRRTVTDAEVAMYVALLLLIQAVMCVAFSGFKLSEARLVPGFGSIGMTSGGTGILILQCTREPGFYSWLSAEVACCGLLALWAGLLAFRTRDVISAFNESVHLANAVFALIFIAATAVPVSILVSDQQDATVLLQGLTIALLVLVWNLALFAPKFYYIRTGRAFQAVAQPRRVRPAKATMVKLKEVDLDLPDQDAPLPPPPHQSVPAPHPAPSNAQRFSILEQSLRQFVQARARLEPVLGGAGTPAPFAEQELADSSSSAHPAMGKSQYHGSESSEHLPSSPEQADKVEVVPNPPAACLVVLSSIKHTRSSEDRIRELGGDDVERTLPPARPTRPVVGGQLQLLSLLSESTSGDSSGNRQLRGGPLADPFSQPYSRPSSSTPSSLPRQSFSINTPGAGCEIDRDVMPEFGLDSASPSADDPAHPPAHLRFLPGQPHSHA